MKEYDLVVIGGGPGGYSCAIRASQLGLKVAIIEKDKTLGGTCVNVGCIPSKALLESSHKYYDAMHSSNEHGITFSKLQFDLTQMMNRKLSIVKELTDGLNFLMKKNKIEVFYGIGSFQKKTSEGIFISVSNKSHTKSTAKKSSPKTSIKAVKTNSKELPETETILKTKKCVIATGSENINLAHLQTDGLSILDSTDVLSLPKVPKKLAIIGAGVIGLEMGCVWNRLGAEVHIIETMPRLLMPLDSDIASLATRLLNKQGIHFYFDHKCIQAKKQQSSNKKINEIELILEKKIDKTPNNITKEEIALKCNQVLVAVGRKAHTENLNLESIGISSNTKGQIEINPSTFETNIANIYAIGDVTYGPMLAHKAEEEGVKVAEYLSNTHTNHINYNAVPWVIYTWPEIAWVGKSQQELEKEQIEYNVGQCFFKANGRAKGAGETDGKIKLLADKHTDELLGAFIVGPNASELIAEAVIAIEFGASADDLARSFHAHPTLCEVMKEAALDVNKKAIHS